jgi:predicted phage tail protein
MLREIRLYGALAKFIGKRVLRAEVATAAEAIRFLVTNWPEVEQHMADRYYKVSVGDYELPLAEIHDPAGQQVIRITPVVSGAGGGPGAQIAIGIALIALSFAIPGAAFGAVINGSIASGVGNAILIGGKIIGAIGLSLTLGGVAGLIAPTPKADKEAKDPRKSFSFSGIQNTSRQNLAIPIIYGETFVGSIVASASIDIVQVTSGKAAATSGSSGTKAQSK